MKVVILCGGKGTRFAEVTTSTPKPMVIVGDRPIIIHIMRWFEKYGHDQFYLPLGYLEEQFKQYFSQYHILHSDFSIEADSKKPNLINECRTNRKVTLISTGLETKTGGRLLKLKKYLSNERFLLTYGDGVSNIPIDKLIDTHKKGGAIVTLTAVRTLPRFGNLCFEDSYISKFEEKIITDDFWINGGFMVLEPEIFDYIKDGQTSLERDVLPVLAEERQLKAYKHYGDWYCMDTQKDWTHLQNIWENDEAWWKVA